VTPYGSHFILAFSADLLPDRPQHLWRR
jgi:hypothetical protein